MLATSTVEQARSLDGPGQRAGREAVAGNTPQCNEWRERRRVNPLLPARREGKGRILSFPEIVRAETRPGKSLAADENPEPGPTPKKSERRSPPQWVLLRNHEEISRTILESFPKGPALTSEAPITTVAELLNRAASRETIAHFVNFDRQHPLAPFRVTVRKQFTGRVKSVLCLSPEKDEPSSLQFEESAEAVTFAVPAMRLYSMLVIAHE